MVDADSMRTLRQFQNKKPAVGVKPLLSFSGSAFESPTHNAYTLAKSLFTDFFKGPDAKNVDVEGLQYMINFAVDEEGGEGSVKPVIHMRSYVLRTKKNGTSNLPRVEVEEMGPRIDFRVGRVREADPAVWKAAMRRPKSLQVCIVFLSASRMSFANISPAEGKEEYRHRHYRRQSWSHTSWPTGSKRAANEEDEGFEAKSRRCGRWRRFHGFGRRDRCRCE